MRTQTQVNLLRKLVADPVSPVEGDVYFNTTDKIAYCFDGTIWKALYA